MAIKFSREKEQALLAWLTQQGRCFRRSLMGLVLLSLSIFVTRLGLMWLLALAMQCLIIAADPPSASLLLAIFCCFLAQAGLTLLRSFLSGRAEQRIIVHFHRVLATRLQRYNLALIREKPTVHWQAHFTDRIPAISQFYVSYQVQKQIAAIAPVIILAVILPLSWLVALFLVISAPLIPLFMWLTGMGAASAHRQHFVAMDRLSHHFLDRLRGRQLLQIFDRVEAEKSHFVDAGNELNERTLKVVRVAFLSSSVLDFFSTVAMALVAVIVGFSLLGEISIGTWAAPLDFQHGLFLLLITPLFFVELKLLGRDYHTKSEAIGAADELQGLLDDDVGLITLQSQTLPIELPRWTLVDGSGEALLHAAPLSLTPGQRVLLSGPSGSGKTLLLELLLGLQPNLLCDGSSFPVLAQSEVFWLGQKSIMMPGTVRELLSYGEPFADEQLLGAIDKVELSSWLTQLSDGLDTHLGEHLPMSGGQAQRFGLARALLFDRPVVFLDEPTAHLCDEQHQRLVGLLQRYLVDKTVVWISHRKVAREWFTQQWQVSAEGVVSACDVAEHAS